MALTKTKDEIEKLRKGGALLSKALDSAIKLIKPGVKVSELNAEAERVIREGGGEPSFLNYKQSPTDTPFPSTVCISINDEIVHGIGGKRVIQPGDIIKLDVGIIKNGWVGDNALTVPVGNVGREVENLLIATEESLHIAISFARDGVMLGDLCASIERHVRTKGYSVVREFVGHGVGKKLHEPPQIPNYRPESNRPKLRAGMILAIEPMVNLGKPGIKMLDDDWTVVTADGSPSSHFEHTVLVTEDEPEILTWREKRMIVPSDT